MLQRLFLSAAMRKTGLSRSSTCFASTGAIRFVFSRGPADEAANFAFRVDEMLLNDKRKAMSNSKFAIIRTKKFRVYRVFFYFIRTYSRKRSDHIVKKIGYGTYNSFSLVLVYLISKIHVFTDCKRTKQGGRLIQLERIPDI